MVSFAGQERDGQQGPLGLVRNDADRRARSLRELAGRSKEVGLGRVSQGWSADRRQRQDLADPKDKKFERPLRDYLAIFRACEMHRTLFADRWESTSRDLSYLEAAEPGSEEPGGLGGKGEDPGRQGTRAGPSRANGRGKHSCRPAEHARASTRRPSKRRLPRTSNMRRKLPSCRKKRPI